MKFRKKTKRKYPYKFQTLACNYPIPCTVKIIRIRRSKSPFETRYVFKITRVVDSLHQASVGLEDYGYLSDFPTYKKIYDAELRKVLAKKEKSLNNG